MARSILFCSIFPLFLIVGCGVTPQPYVIDVEKLAGAKPAKAEQLLKEMIPTQLLEDCRMGEQNEHSCVVIINCWEVAKGQIPDADAGRITSRTYSIEQRSNHGRRRRSRPSSLILMNTWCQMSIRSS